MLGRRYYFVLSRYGPEPGGLCLRTFTRFLCLLTVVALIVTVGPGRASAVETPYGVNLLDNPGFERGLSRPADWQWVDADWALRDGRDPFAGEASGLLAAFAEEREPAWSQGGVRLQAGERYMLAGYVRSDAPAVAALGVEWGPEGEKRGQRLHRGLLADAPWQRVELEFVSPETVTATAYFGGTVHGSIWWDDVSLERVDDRTQKLAEQWEALIERHGEVYTGLIIDARGLGMRRGMSPKIVDEGGNVLYAGAEADRSVIMGLGLVSYMSDPDEVLKHHRLAVHERFPYTVPLMVSAVDLVDDPFHASAVISVADAARIRRELDKYDFLGRHAVVFLVGDDGE